MQISANDIITRLKSALKISTDAELARVINTSASNIATWKARNSVDHDGIIAICEQNGINLNDIFYREVDKMQRLNEPLSSYKRGKSVGLPLIPIEAMAGVGKGDTSVLEFESERYVIPEFNKKADYLIRISGTSMSPKYFNGDIVACKIIPTRTFLQWGKVYVMDTVQGPICKRVLPGEKKGVIICRSENRDLYPDFEISWNDVRSLAMVIGTIRLE